MLRRGVPNPHPRTRSQPLLFPGRFIVNYSVVSKEIKHILLLDDEPSVLLALKLLLQALGFTVSAFDKALEALEHFRSNESVELFISDLRMPIMSGLEVLAEAKRIRPSVPVVLMSAHAAEAEQAYAKSAGCFGFLSKPFTVQDLQNLVQKVQADS